MIAKAAAFWNRLSPGLKSKRLKAEEFRQLLAKNIESCRWEPHPLYSVFTQYDQEYYLKLREDFTHKYRCFYAVSKTILPSSIIEMGTCAGASADAYLSAAPRARYLGIDVFGENTRHSDQSPWQPYEIAKLLFADRGFKEWQLMKTDLRHLYQLPEQADLVVVDAAHDFANEYADLKLALTAHPTFILVDDADDPEGAKPAIDKFVEEDLRGRVEYLTHVSYIGGGVVIKLTD